jgi:hypothetical protein
MPGVHRSGDDSNGKIIFANNAGLVHFILHIVEFDT